MSTSIHVSPSILHLYKQWHLHAFTMFFWRQKHKSEHSTPIYAVSWPSFKKYRCLQCLVKHARKTYGKNGSVFSHGITSSFQFWQQKTLVLAVLRQLTCSFFGSCSTPGQIDIFRQFFAATLTDSKYGKMPTCA